MTDHGGAASPRTDPLPDGLRRDLIRAVAGLDGYANPNTARGDYWDKRLALVFEVVQPYLAAQEAPAPEGLPTILEATDWPRVRCSKCGSQLLGRGWLEHHADGSHSFYPAEARQPEGPCARHWGSDGTLCSTHNGRFASTSENRCDRAEARPPEGLDSALEREIDALEGMGTLTGHQAAWRLRALAARLSAGGAE